MHKTVNIIIVTWNALDYTKISLSSLFKNTHYPAFLTIVDNGSTDGTIEYLDNLQPLGAIKQIKLIKNKKNLGYGGAINQGYLQFNTNYVVVANNDVIFTESWLTKLINVYEKEPNIGVLAPLRPAPFCKHPYSKFDTNKIIEGIKNNLTIEEELHEYCRGKNFKKFVNDLLNTNKFGTLDFTGPPIHIVTCCAMLSSEVITLVGGLADDRFKIFGCDDTDLSWRISQRGKRLVITSDVYVHHFKHKSSNANNQNRQELCKMNNIIFFKEWKNVIISFIEKELQNGIDVKRKMTDESDYNYWFLRRLNENIKFWEDGIIN